MSEERRNWTHRYPQRWARELAALRATGWHFEALTRDGETVLRVDYPLTGPSGGDPGQGPASSDPARLMVVFPEEYPFFPPAVIDPENTLGIARHRNATGYLCLVEDADWHLESTVAGLLTTQVPVLIEAGRSTGRPPPGLEAQAPEPVGDLVDRVLSIGLIMPETSLPAGADQGALVVRASVMRGVGVGAFLVERLLGEGIDIPGPAPRRLTVFPVICHGRWARDPAFDLDDTAEETYRRLQSRLLPLLLTEPAEDADGEDAADTEAMDQAQDQNRDQDPDEEEDEEEGDGRRATVRVPLDELEILCLLVPGEGEYREAGEQWVALSRSCIGDHVWYDYLPVQFLGPEHATARTPGTDVLAQRHVVIVGAGALGGHIAEDLTRTGVGHLDLVDPDRVDVATASRQYAPPHSAGHSKAATLLSRLAVNQPMVRLRGFSVRLGNTHQVSRHAAVRRRVEAALTSADLVIDATAAPLATRYLAALRQGGGGDFLHVSGTAGAWGGCVYLSTGTHGCWSCLQHHRIEGTVPVPPADPTGWITPRGCAAPTFTGTNADLATVAHHASRVAIDRLLGGDGLGGHLYVASLRTRGGAPQPVQWQAVEVPVHPACPLHPAQHAQEETSDGSGNGEAVCGDCTPAGTPDDLAQPHEREADGHSPPGTDPTNSTEETTQAPADQPVVGCGTAIRARRR